VRKKRKTTISGQVVAAQHMPGCAEPSVEARSGTTLNQRSPEAPTPALSASVDAGTITTSPFHAPDSHGHGAILGCIDPPPQDPGTSSSTYIGRSHYEGDTAIDETTARAYALSRQPELSELEQKTLELWNVYNLPPRAVHESLVEAFNEYCSPWMPILELTDMLSRNASSTSLLLSQAVYLAASRVTSSASVKAFSSSAEFYQRAKALYWVGHEKTPLTVIQAITMLHWYTPDGPAHVSYDTSEYWLKIGVGLAYQIGLHREPSAGPIRAIRRRMWWTLVVSISLRPFYALPTCSVHVSCNCSGSPHTA
jgi:hypothetical protein